MFVRLYFFKNRNFLIKSFTVILVIMKREAAYDIDKCRGFWDGCKRKKKGRK